MRSVRLLALAGVAATAVAAPSAGAIGTGASTELVGAAVVTRAITTDSIGTNVSTANLTGYCTYARHAVGVGGSGITFELVAAGTAGGAYKGIPVVATGVACRFIRTSGTVSFGPEFLPGPAAASNRSYTSNDASAGRVCVEVWALLRQAPPGEPDALISSGEQCS